MTNPYKEFVTQDKGRAFQAHSEALTSLLLETLKMLKSKNVISDEDIEAIFDASISESGEQVEHFIDQIKWSLNPIDDEDDDE